MAAFTSGLNFLLDFEKESLGKAYPAEKTRRVKGLPMLGRKLWLGRTVKGTKGHVPSTKEKLTKQERRANL